MRHVYMCIHHACMHTQARTNGWMLHHMHHIQPPAPITHTAASDMGDSVGPRSPSEPASGLTTAREGSRPLDLEASPEGGHAQQALPSRDLGGPQESEGVAIEGEPTEGGPTEGPVSARDTMRGSSRCGSSAMDRLSQLQAFYGTEAVGGACVCASLCMGQCGFTVCVSKHVHVSMFPQPPTTLKQS